MSLEPENSAPSMVTDHMYVPRDRDEPWSLCRDCALAEAAHARSVHEVVDDVRPTPFPVAEIDLSEMQEHAVRDSKEES